MITLGQRKIIKNIKRRWAHIWFDSETHGICLCFYAWLCKFKLKQKPLSQTVVKKFGMLFIWCFPTSTSIPYISILIVCWSQCSSHNNPKNQKLFRSTTHSIILILMYSYLRSFFFFFFLAKTPEFVQLWPVFPWTSSRYCRIQSRTLCCL